MRRYVTSWRQWPVRLLVLASTGLAGTGFVAACGSPSAATFHPAAGTASAAPAPSVPAGGAAARAFAMPPFGSDVHIVMTRWLPASSHDVPAVLADKNFLLAFLYAEYRGNQDHRWSRYVTGGPRRALTANLSEPNVTAESFTGTIRFTHMKAFADPSRPGAVDVSACFDNSHSDNTSLATGRVITDRTPPDQHYYRNTDVLSKDSHHRWHVVAIYPVVYYPQAKECKP